MPSAGYLTDAQGYTPLNICIGPPNISIIPGDQWLYTLNGTGEARTVSESQPLGLAALTPSLVRQVNNRLETDSRCKSAR